jgi:hypothetical protein
MEKVEFQIQGRIQVVSPETQIARLLKRIFRKLIFPDQPAGADIKSD